MFGVSARALLKWYSEVPGVDTATYFAGVTAAGKQRFNKRAFDMPTMRRILADANCTQLRDAVSALGLDARLKTSVEQWFEPTTTPQGRAERQSLQWRQPSPPELGSEITAHRNLVAAAVNRLPTTKAFAHQIVTVMRWQAQVSFYSGNVSTWYAPLAPGADSWEANEVNVNRQLTEAVFTSSCRPASEGEQVSTITLRSNQNALILSEDFEDFNGQLLAQPAPAVHDSNVNGNDSNHNAAGSSTATTSPSVGRRVDSDDSSSRNAVSVSRSVASASGSAATTSRTHHVRMPRQRSRVGKRAAKRTRGS